MTDAIDTDSRPFQAGQSWTYRAPAGFETSRIVIGAILEFANADRVMAVSVFNAPQRRADGTVARGTIPLLPMSEAALRDTVIFCEGSADLPDDFITAFDSWNSDDCGGTFFTVAFDGHLDRLIARQMAALAD